MNENNIVMLEDVWKIYKNGEHVIHSLANINYSVEEGSFSIIYGPSGSGKSTLIRVIGLLEKPTMGKVWIKGKNSGKLAQKKRNIVIRDEIGFLFQGSNLIPTLNALENITLPMLNSDKNLAKKLLEKVGFSDHKKLPKEMSIEEGRRVSLARAMVNNHSIILADEPTGDLHTADSEKFIKILQELNRTEDLTVVVTTNNRNISKLGGNLIEIADGTFVQ
ncbi:ABC transporter ATP-binding protein [Methanobacterium spitsbergense]|uniref:ATP-binding cassette domain-containing protein n=1 Tax=Methanobacterium spitsbergense TaxID=2874285 RepID=A0A8T5UPR1_9EURY|nr:ATP-binding cassette domain-containing protein [Methanobacterium spitsbergense]MBZ2165644.1 ATP-binding cassette domain-containing protein [Methanobacterium spitsbergense]